MSDESGEVPAAQLLGKRAVEEVAGGLRLLGYSFLAHAGVSVLHRIANEVLFGFVRSSSDGYAKISSLLTILFTVTRIMSLGASALAVLGAMRLSKLPPRETATSPQAYRDAPGVVRTARDGGLAPLVLGILVVSIVLDVVSFAIDLLPGARAPRDGFGVRDAVWLMGIFADVGMQAGILVWIRRVTRSFADAPGEKAPADPSAMIALAGSLIAARTLYLVYYWTFKPKLPSAISWLTLGAYLTSMVLLFLLTNGAATALSKAAASMASGAGSSDHSRPREALGPGFRHAADGLDRFATALKLQLGIGVMSAVITGVAAASRSIETITTMFTLSPIAGLFLAALAVAGLIRYAEIPEESGAASPARIAAVLLGMGSLGHVYHLTLVPDLASDSIFTKAKAMENVPAVLGLTQLLGFASTMVLLASLRKAAIALDDNALTIRADAVTKLFYGTLALAGLTFGAAMSRDLAPFATLLALVLVAVALITVVRYVGLLGDLVTAMRR